MADIVKEILAKPIQLADQISKAADEAQSFKQECQELKAKTERLSALLRQAARASDGLYERPTRRIIEDTEEVLDKSLSLVLKCRASGIMKRMFTIIPTAAFRKSTIQLENSIGDVSWLLRVSTSADERDDEYLGLPPIAANEPILCLIWEQIAILYTGSLEERSDAAASLVSLARDNDRYGKLIMEEGGIPPLLKLAKEGMMEGQENAARAIGLLGRDPESVERIVNDGVGIVFAKILKEGHMKVQAVVAWAVSELAGNYPKCQDHFSQNNIIRFLVSHLAFETVQEHSKYAIGSKNPMSIHSVVMASNGAAPESQLKGDNEEDDTVKMANPGISRSSKQIHDVITNTLATKSNVHPIPKTIDNQGSRARKNGRVHSKQRYNHSENHVSLTGTSIKRRELEDPETKAEMKAMAARALWQLSKRNVNICQSITESRALLCFAVLLEKGPEDVRSYSAMALMEITEVAEHNSNLRHSSFKPTSPAAKTVVDKLLQIVEKEKSELLIPCIKAIGNLARTFRATETRMIGPLVKLLDEREPEVMREAAIALNKFASTENYLCVNHSKAIIGASGAKHLIQLVYFGEQMVQIPALILLCYITLNCPDSTVLGNEEVLIVLEWASKQAPLMEDSFVVSLLSDAKSRLELYQSRGSRGFY